MVDKFPIFVYYSTKNGKNKRFYSDTIQYLECCSYAIAAEQKARVTYDNILRLSDDPDVNDAIKFLREREVVHFQRFGEALRLAKERMNSKNVYYLNPSFDTPSK